MPQNRLKKYREKRDFDTTPEPDANEQKASAKPVWVIQKHEASNLYYDFRLEVDGVLKSWVIPKGPSTDPSEKRLAIPTEDHPVEYAQFEGTIPEDQYGGGTVMIWDSGTYRSLNDNSDDKEKKTRSMSAAHEAGHISVYLEGGQKISGGYALIRTDMADDERWLLVKMEDDQADARRNPVSTEPDSAATERSLREIEADEKD